MLITVLQLESKILIVKRVTKTIARTIKIIIIKIKIVILEMMIKQR